MYSNYAHGLCNNNYVLISAVPGHDGKGVDVEMCIVIMPMACVIIIMY